MTDGLKEEFKEEKRIREIAADGVKTEFWAEIRFLLRDLQEQASEALKNVQPSDVGKIAELQQMYKVPALVIDIVESLAEEQDRLDEKQKKKIGVKK